MTTTQRHPRKPIGVTMLELVTAVAEFAQTENEMLATVVHLVNSGAVELIGNFRGHTFDLDAFDLAA
jgi:hypothetical protein